MIIIENLHKEFQSGNVITPVLKGIDLKIDEGEFVSIIGPSGSGKSTFLYQMALLDEPTSGKIIINGQSTHGLNEKQKTAFRLENFGFIFQDYAVLPELTALENVMLPLLMRGDSNKSAKKKAQELLEEVDLADKRHLLPRQLSGGQQQRVSIARSVATEPRILFADEPTASLDSTSSEAVLKVLKTLHEHRNQTIVMVTHENIYAKRTDRIIKLKDGIIESHNAIL